MDMAECKPNCGHLRSLLEGHAGDEQSATCSHCRAASLWLSSLPSAFAPETVPSDVTESLFAIFPDPPARRASWVRTSLGLGTRSARVAFQGELEANGMSIHLMSTPEGEGWRVVGQISPAPVTAVMMVASRDEIAVSTEGRFRVLNLQPTDSLVLFADGTRIELPTSEVLHDAFKH